MAGRGFPSPVSLIAIIAKLAFLLRGTYVDKDTIKDKMFLALNEGSYMRKIIVISMITLDGVMQAPGGPEEDTSGGFKYGGWQAPYLDEVSGKVMANLMKPAAYLLGRKTFEIWAGYWPEHADVWPAINDGTKYVMSTTMEKSDWKNTVFIKSVADIEKLKNSEGSDIQVWGSSKLIQLLLKNDLVDELWLIIHPLTLGAGKRLFDSGTMPAAFTLTESTITPSGVIMANYKRAGEVKTGTIGA
jgi:dihydrofolate reductase